MKIDTPLGCWRIGTRVRKKSGSNWQGTVCGYYSTSLTDVGYAVESERELGSVQIYPAAALVLVERAECWCCGGGGQIHDGVSGTLYDCPECGGSGRAKQSRKLEDQ
jgi:predicted RNA-binding Zn-ribbon protein involved in translation (DUF1610 family)